MAAADTNVPDKLLEIESQLSCDLSFLRFELPITHVYNPLEYACEPHRDYVQKYCTSQKRILFVGMNPGPFGMAQNGVPFGDPKYVKDWLEITGDIYKPSNEHPKRPILGWDSKRSEVSGARFWGFFEKYSKIPQNFFSNCFVYNFCPLVFMGETGKNITPNSIPAAQRKELFTLCDDALQAVVELLNVDILMCLGKFVESQCSRIYKYSEDIQINGLMHPSPANPKANAGWENIAFQQLNAAGVMQYISA